MNKDNKQQFYNFLKMVLKNKKFVCHPGPLAQSVVARVLYTRGRGFEPHMDQ